MINIVSLSIVFINLYFSVQPESIILVQATVVAPVEPVKSCSVQDAELKITKVKLTFSYNIQWFVNFNF
jgi:aspartyl-tRNA synthetase